MKKQIMSIAAAAALFTTGAMAFDAQRTTGNAGLETDELTFKPAVMNVNNISTVGSTLRVGNNQSGDALIYPAFYSQKGWSTEFSVINNSPDSAVIAKVVLYSAIDSKELRDFNIYLSANDVFRATIEDGKLISTDSSTRASAQDTVSSANLVKVGYTRKDTAPMASEAQPFETTVDEPVGYFAVFAMAETNSSASYAPAGEEPFATYHKKHNELWQDYRHLLDQCRGEGWRTTSNNYGGIFISNTMGVPNTDLSGGNQILPSGNQWTPAAADCGLVASTQYTKYDTTAFSVTVGQVQFQNPSDNLLSGSVLVRGDDSKGTRSMLLPATAINNFTDDNNNTGLLWTEGELANIADRCIVKADDNITTYGVNDGIKYDTACLEADINAVFNITNTKYEFRDAENSQLLITQPYKRVLVQIADKESTLPYTGATVHGSTSFSTRASYYNKNVVRAKDANDNIKNVTDYGQFDLAQPDIYDDNENPSTSTSDGYIVSPAPIQASTPGIPNELSVFNPLGSYNDSMKGFATINYAAYAHGIVTQMSADTVSETSETNWIYPVTN